MQNSKFRTLSPEAKLLRLERIINLLAPNLEVGDWLKDIPLNEQMKFKLASKHDVLSMARSYTKSPKHYQQCQWIYGNGIPGNLQSDPLFSVGEDQVVFVSQTNLDNPIRPIKNFNTLLIYCHE